MRHFITRAALALALITTSSALMAQEDPIVAKVGGESIKRSQVMAAAANLPPQLQSAPPQQVFPQLLEQIITQKVVAEAGYNDKLQNSDEVKAKLKELEATVVADAYLRKTIKPQISDELLKKEYAEILGRTKPQDEVRASHILVGTEAEAKEIIKQLKGGKADFAEIAKAKSKDKGAAERGGDLGFFLAGEMVKPFSDAAFGMKVGDVSTKPVKSDFGWHVIKVVDRRQAKAPSLDQVRPQLENQVGRKLVAVEVKKLLDNAKIERFDFNGKPVAAN